MPADGSKFRLYFSGGGSWGRVAAGCAEGLAGAGVLEGKVDLAAARTIDGGASPDGADADIGIAIGDPSAWSAPYRRGAHPVRLALVAPNSSWVPPLLGSMVMNEGLTGAIAPSTWAKRILEQNLDGSAPVHLWQHGIDEAYRPDPAANERLAGEPFRVLHLSSTMGLRKGTLELLDAWHMLFKAGALGERDFLGIVAPPLCGGIVLTDRIAQLGLQEHAMLRERLDAPPAAMCTFMQKFKVVCQPSRSEGFGWCPIEARASGIPIVATACTGHADHLGGAAAVIVQHGPDGPIDDGPGATAPTVTASAIAEALASAKQRWEDLSKAALAEADSVRERWSWRRTTGDFLETIREAP